MGHISRRHYVEGKKDRYAFGIDRVGGLFLTVFDEEGAVKVNYTQILPIQKRFTPEEIEKTIPAEDLALIRAHKTRPVNVFFEIYVRDNHDETKTSDILLRNLEGEPIECYTFGDLIDAHTHFTPEEYFAYVSFVDPPTAEIVELGNDAEGILF